VNNNQAAITCTSIYCHSTVQQQMAQVLGHTRQSDGELPDIGVFSLPRKHGRYLATGSHAII